MHAYDMQYLVCAWEGASEGYFQNSWWTTSGNFLFLESSYFQQVITVLSTHLRVFQKCTFRFLRLPFVKLYIFKKFLFLDTDHINRYPLLWIACV
jgi:hypothetical protein